MTLWTPDGEYEPNLSPEQTDQAREMAHELAEARARILEVDAADVVANHAVGIYELAAIHLTADEPRLADAQVAIDALAGLLDGAKGRLGEGEPTLVEGLSNLRMAFVQRSQGKD